MFTITSTLQCERSQVNFRSAIEVSYQFKTGCYNFKIFYVSLMVTTRGKDL